MITALLHAGLLLKEYKTKFSGSPVTATYTYLKYLLRDTLPNNPLVSHETAPEKLRDPAFLARALRYASIFCETQRLAMRFSVLPRWGLSVCHFIN